MLAMSIWLLSQLCKELLLLPQLRTWRGSLQLTCVDCNQNHAQPQDPQACSRLEQTAWGALSEQDPGS